MSHRAEIDVQLVRELVAEQFPRWAKLPLKAVDVMGWDNASFRLGDEMVVRLPRAAEYESQILKEQRWLPILGPHLPLAIPKPLALGHAGQAYPWTWAVRAWIDGETASPEAIGDPDRFVAALAGFLNALQGIPTDGGPPAGPQSFHRGGSLDVYDDEVRAATSRLRERVDEGVALGIWEDATRTAWTCRPVWVHGDISTGNLLIRRGELVAVIDFGQLAIGDPACDLAVAWTLFRAPHREAFRAALQPDPGTWARGRAWALWKALIVTAGLSQTSALETAQAERTLDAVVQE